MQDKMPFCSQKSPVRKGQGCMHTGDVLEPEFQYVGQSGDNPLHHVL